jgi:death on curing protein
MTPSAPVRISAEEVLALHDRLVQSTGGSHGVRDLGALVSMLGRPFGGTERADFYPSVEEKAAALCHGLVREHPFADANHRTGVAAAALFLERNGRRFAARPAEIVAFARGVAGEHHRIDEMAEWFQTHTEHARGSRARAKKERRHA